MEDLNDDVSMDGASSSSSEVSVHKKEAGRSFRKNWNKPIYKYFKSTSSSDSSRVKCLECGDDFVNHSGSLKRHLRRKHSAASAVVEAALAEEAASMSKPPKAKVSNRNQKKISNSSVASPMKKSAVELEEASPVSKRARVKSPPLSSDDEHFVTEPFEEVDLQQGTIEQLREEVAGLQAKIKDCHRRMRFDLADYKAQIKEAKREMHSAMEVFKVQLRSQGVMSTRIEITPLVTRYTINGATGELRQEPSTKRT